MQDSERITYIHQPSEAFDALLQREWLLTNGIGGFAAGTVTGVNTRRYHGLLIAAALPPVGRIMTVARTADLLWIDGRRFDLSAALFGEKLIGDGVDLLKRFELAGNVARWEFEIEGTTVHKELMLCRGKNACGVRYIVRRADGHFRSDLRLSILPLVALRDFHALRRRGQGQEIDSRAAGVRGVILRAGELHVRIDADDGHFAPRSDWWAGHTYPVETDRGLDDTEDLFAPGAFELDCGELETKLTLWISTSSEPGRFALDQEHEQTRAAFKAVALPTPVQRKLARAADDFVVQRRRRGGTEGTSVIAGYPWFADWGRDAFISLPGLLLATGRFEEARQLLDTFAEHLSEGMIPNRFDDYTGRPEYNSVDASLWYIHAAQQYARAAGDAESFQRMRPACMQIIEHYTRGTRFNIHVDSADGLLTAGDQTTQLTWMDAKRDGVVFTPRHGKAVEVNALWYNALMLLGEHDRADRVRRSFTDAFRAGEGAGLFDVVNEQGIDRSIRPNQIFAVSLPHSPLEADQRRAVVEVVAEHLLTPYGLRTLSSHDPRYQPHFTGSLFERDRAYHNGTVWPWLIGPFLDAYLKTHANSAAARQQARRWLAPLLEHFETQGCLGSISEVFDAEPPHHPGGCFAQAWSVAEVLRLAVLLEV